MPGKINTFFIKSAAENNTLNKKIIKKQTDKNTEIRFSGNRFVDPIPTAQLVSCKLIFFIN